MFQDYLDDAIAYLSELEPLLLIPLTFGVIIGVIAQWSLYEKAGCRGVACLVPVWNVMEFMKITGRPGWHGLFLMIPPPIIVALFLWDPLSPVTYAVSAGLMLFMFGFVIKVYIELCNCFGRNNFFDYLLVFVFNGIYVLWLGLSEVKYKGPVYNKSKAAPKAAPITA